jgi:hypothetical protein
MAATQTVTRRDLETRLIERAWKDPVFRNDVVKDPKGMLEKHTGQKLPEHVQIIVHEEDANTLHFSIPPPPSNLNELSDEDLERVAGGTDLIGTLIAATIGLTVGGVSGVAIGTAIAKPW